MKPLDLASGDLLADRRADYAEMLFASGEHAAAGEVLLGALELAPGWALGWFRLGEMRSEAGAFEAAAKAWRMSLELDPDDRAGATLKLELIGAAPVSDAPPSPFVEALFDHYAPTFETALVQKLDYRVPELLETAIRIARSEFGPCADLGCGTGLMGERLRPMVARLDGYDISRAMLKKAASKNIYDSLTKADLQTLELPRASLDLVTAADVFMYVGALDDLVPKVAAALYPSGVFAFSVEHHRGEANFMLLPSRRYAHSEIHLRALLAGSGFTLHSLENADIRKDRGEPIEGLIGVAIKQ
ncbi:methyltransferase domain-containing protein [Mesorhizobium sp. NBSH29]|uniref:class I SAM-dependent DNA methyltransferase n=1 Tax=Mesorhizobium sp. NBSH29 TaxID=2654249 RepID=UPI0018966F91|nr:methyltransferase domain-containing protein [Mesorhizobium sp. NBSH29]QPC86711.1 methyltransferase domain-containing protein [Mesorhizobium sp. NBSH29]